MGERYSLRISGGQLEAEEREGQAVFSVTAPDDAKGLYKAWLTGGSERLLLGTLMPEGGALRLRRSLPLESLRRKGLWPPRGGEVRLAFAFDQGGKEPAQPTRPPQPSRPPRGWQRAQEPGRRLGDALLRRSAAAVEDLLFREEAWGFVLAAPWSPGSPFPLTPLFCFAFLEELGGGMWAVFHFTPRGCPRFPEEG